MLSYRHSFHAGNHADVLKHIVLVELLRYLTRKDKPLWYIDTHAGAGVYAPSNHPAAGKERQSGIARLWNAAGAPPLVEHYLQQVRELNPDGALTRYPGSPWLAAALLRAEDRLWLSELHPADHAALTGLFAERDLRVRVEQQDGFATLRALLPPQPRRALVMIDPSYELSADYLAIPAALTDARRRFETGVYAVWYPTLQSREARGLPAALRAVAGPKWLDAQLLVREPAAGGMFGSGMFVVNPPYSLAEALEATLPWLTGRLAQGPHATWSVESSPGTVSGSR